MIFFLYKLKPLLHQINYIKEHRKLISLSRKSNEKVVDTYLTISDSLLAI